MVPLALLDRPLGRPELLISRGDRSVADDLVYVRSNRDDLEWYDGPVPETEEPVLEIYTVADRDHVLSVEPEVDRQLKGLGRTTAIHQPVYGPRDWAFEVHAPTASKWNGLRRLMDRWKVPPGGIVAIGDDINDIPMLEAAGLSFAMGNAVDRVREVADRRTASNDEDGVVRALETVFPDLLA
jgi:hydroxymethylpyrimidine pyrophosphatase-like HAD family hydrolase